MFFSEFFEGYSNLYLLDDLLGLLEKDGFIAYKCRDST